MNALRYLPFVGRGFVHAGPPVHLTVYVTGRCNLRCRHCFHFKEVAEGVAGPPLDDLRRLADSAARLGPLLWVSFGGGEPFLREDLSEVAGAFARHGLRHLAIPTNGLVEDRQTEFVRKTLSEFPDLHLSVSVSFDGPSEIHDAIRQVPGGHARSMASVRALQALKKEFPQLGVGLLVCVTSENQHVLPGHVEELVRELRPDNVTVNLARGTALDESLLEVDVANYERVVEAKARLTREGILPYFDFPLSRLAVARDTLMYEHVARVARDDQSRYLPCTAGRLSAVVFESGDVQPCEILGRSLGNLNDVGWDLGRIWSSDQANSLRTEIRNERCACTWECAQADNVLFNKRTWPKLALRTLKP